MRNFLTSIVLLFLTISFVHGQVIFTKPQSPRTSNYKIKAFLDTEKKVIKGEMTLIRKNTSSDTLNDLHFHAYMNAFKNTASTFMKESGGQLRGDFIDTSDESAFGKIEIESFTDENENNLLENFRYIQPDDDNKHDQTVFVVDLEEALAPGTQAKYHIKFETKLPKIFARTGYAKNFYMVAQWFPKIGVYEEDRGWVCPQFHANSEFYADFGVYDVEITLPKNYIVGATGGLQKEEIIGDSLKRLSYRAEDVIDFAWTASKRFIEKKYERKGVNIRILLQPEHFKHEQRHSQSLDAAMDYFEKHIGKYPYKNLTVVDPPVSAAGAGGMEYPTLITAGAFSFLPDGIRLIETLVVHEFGHQYFMGLLASNEFEEAWLDEGLTSYLESRIMDDTYGKGGLIDIWGIKISDAEYQRIGYVRSPFADAAETFRKSWEYPHGAYGVMNYNKPASFLITLERIIGREAMDEILKSYFERFKFKHPKTDDFLSIVKEISRKHHGDKYDTDAFFKQVLYGSQTCDYEVKSLISKKTGGYQGWFDGSHSSEFREGYGAEKYRSVITVIRNGDMVLPGELFVKFDNGDTLTVNFDGKEKIKKFIFDRKHKVVSAVLDPENKIWLDTKLNNNSINKEQEDTGIRKTVLYILYLIQNIIQSAAFFA